MTPVDICNAENIGEAVLLYVFRLLFTAFLIDAKVHNTSTSVFALLIDHGIPWSAQGLVIQCLPQ